MDIVNEQRPSGKRIAVSVILYCGLPMATASVDGKAFGSTPMRAIDARTHDGVTYTHAIGRVLLTSSEASAINAALQALGHTPEAIAAAEERAQSDAKWARQCAAAEGRVVRAQAWERSDMAACFLE